VLDRVASIIREPRRVRDVDVAQRSVVQRAPGVGMRLRVFPLRCRRAGPFWNFERYRALAQTRRTMTRPRKITRRIESFPHLAASLDGHPTAYMISSPIMSFEDTGPSPGYADWKRRYKRKRRKTA